MKNVFIGLLVLAAGAGVYFFLIQKQKGPEQEKGLHKEWITGQWKISPPEPGGDSLLTDGQWEFRKNGEAFYQAAGQTEKDTLRFNWQQDSTLQISSRTNDKFGISFRVLRLTADTMQWEGDEQQTLQLLKLK